MVKYGVVRKKTLFTPALMSVLMVFGGPHLPLAFQFFCGPGRRWGAKKLEGKWKVFHCLVAPPQAAPGYGANSSICWRTTFEDICAVRKKRFSHRRFLA